MEMELILNGLFFLKVCIYLKCFELENYCKDRLI